jgi:hypothetical protein
MQSTWVPVPAVSARGSKSVATAWPPRRSNGGDAALWVGLVAGALTIAALGLAATSEPGTTMLAWAVIAALLAVLAAAALLWALAYRQLHYTLTDTALEVPWCGAVTVVPYGGIDGVYTGQRLVGTATPAVPAWPGIYVGPGRARGIGRLRLFTTTPDPSA